MKYASIDIETTGVDYLENDIIEIGVVFDDLSDPQPLEKLPKFHTYIIKDEYKGNPFALSMHPEIFKRIALKTEGYQYLTPYQLGHRLSDFFVHEWL